ncbi:hypothetical protein BV20DRAFT_977841 [Pilatotrama ljubarskyi]|nr:hypothetical protein BV20DRAFT_977841 [Pilatotrama ljubarskyi]
MTVLSAALYSREFYRRSGENAGTESVPPSAGYPTPIGLADAIKTWVEIHDYAFTISSGITNATVLLAGKIATDYERLPHAFKLKRSSSSSILGSTMRVPR